MTTVGALAQQDPDQLYAQLVETNAEHMVVYELPGPAQVESWIGKAKELRQVVQAVAA